jgi:hypothetical protein
MKHLAVGFATGIAGTRAVIEIFDFFAELMPSMTFIQVMESSAKPILWLALTIVCTIVLYRNLSNRLKQNNDTINRTREDLERSRQ